MNPLDLLLMAALLLPALWGLWKGLVDGAAGPLALVFAALIALGVGAQLGRTFWGQAQAAPLYGAALGFGLSWLWVRLLAALLRRVTSLAGLGWANHLSGALAGGMIGAIAAAALLSGLSSLAPELTALQRSQLSPVIHQLQGVLQPGAGSSAPSLSIGNSAVLDTSALTRAASQG